MEIIHIVLGKANPDRLNGVNKVVYNMATEQTKAGKNVAVWGITKKPVHDYPERNFKTELFDASKFPFFVSETLKKAVLKHRNAVFHLHGGWIPVFSALAKYFNKNHIKFVLTPHGAYNEVAMKRSSFTKKIYFNLFEKRLLKSAYKVHSIGKSEVNGLHNISPASTSFLLPYGFQYTHQIQKITKNEDFTIGFVGRLDTHTKGLDLLLEAFYVFQKKEPNTKLWIIGEGEGQPFLENFIKEKKLTNVVLWGKKFGQEKDELLSKMHVFAHPSRNEGLPTAVLEAAAFRVPTIVTQATNVAEYVSDFQAGIAIDDNDVTSLLDAICILFKIYKNQQTASFVTGAQNMLEQKFSWSVLVDQYDELYT
jgi:glycosyltransferase involved in cell wall biosynthesis